MTKQSIKNSIGQASANLNDCGYRDAFHAPAILACSDDKLKPGDFVRFLTAKKVYKATSRQSSHGIVDPFLPNVDKGVAFWVLLNPDSTSNLQHHFDLNFQSEIEDITKDIKDVEDKNYDDLLTDYNILEDKLRNTEKELRKERRRLEIMEEGSSYDDNSCRGCY